MGYNIIIVYYRRLVECIIIYTITYAIIVMLEAKYTHAVLTADIHQLILQSCCEGQGPLSGLVIISLFRIYKLKLEAESGTLELWGSSKECTCLWA